jgi:hypothetical protein
MVPGVAGDLGNKLLSEPKGQLDRSQTAAGEPAFGVPIIIRFETSMLLFAIYHLASKPPLLYVTMSTLSSFRLYLLMIMKEEVTYSD